MKTIYPLSRCVFPRILFVLSFCSTIPKTGDGNGPRFRYSLYNNQNSLEFPPELFEECVTPLP